MGILMLILGVIFSIAVLLALFYRFWFLRDPLRIAPSGSSIVSPGDGRIIDIKGINGNVSIRKGRGEISAFCSDTAKECILITIFMTPFNVHYQRAPCEGRVISVRHTRGRFRSADKPRPENENNQILIKTRIGNMKVIQIAGFIARRIVCFVKEDQNIKKGQKLGIIRLGSQVCLALPKTKKIKLAVRKGDRVKAGESIIAHISK